MAFRNARDRHHEWAKGVADNITEPLFVCEAGLAETAYRLDVVRALSFLEEGTVRLAFEIADHLPRLKELAVRYQDRKPDLALGGHLKTDHRGSLPKPTNGHHPGQEFVLPRPPWWRQP